MRQSQIWQRQRLLQIGRRISATPFFYFTSLYNITLYINMNCPICRAKVLNNSDYSVHMNLTHRGKTYSPLDYKNLNRSNKDLNKGKGKGNYESNNRTKTNVDSRLD